MFAALLHRKKVLRTIVCLSTLDTPTPPEVPMRESETEDPTP